MELLKKYNGLWTINRQPIFDYVNSLSNNNDALDLVMAYILDTLASNYEFMNDFVAYCGKNVIMSYPFSVALKQGDPTLTIDFTIDMFIRYYENNYSNLNVWQKVVFKLLKRYSSDRHSNKVLDKNILKSGFTYNNLKELLLLNQVEFHNKVLSNKDLAQRLYNLKESWEGQNEFLRDLELIFNFDEHQLFLIKENLNLLTYYYEPNLEILKPFHTKDNIPGSFTLSDKLVNEIMGGMPESFDRLEKAYYIYYRLCEKFYYDEEYFGYSYGTVPQSIKDKPTIDHTDITRLSNIEINSGVVCNEITMLYVAFLKILQIKYQIVGYYENQVIRYGKTHMKVRFLVDDYIIDADAGNGVFNSDMSAVKIFQETNGFIPSSALPLRVQHECQEKMRKVEDYIESKAEDNEFNDALEVYENLYVRDNNTSFMEKIDILKDMVKRTKSPFIVMFSWVKEIVDKLFGKDNDHCHGEFLINYRPTDPNRNYELVLVIIYNKHTPINEDYTNNQYLVITEDRQEELLDYNEFKRRTGIKIYDFTTKIRKDKYDFGEDYDVRKRNK